MLPGETQERRGGPAQETRSRNRARGGCSLATRPGSGKRRTKMERLFSTDRYLAQLYSNRGWMELQEQQKLGLGEGGIGRNRKQSRPVPDAELEGVGAAVGAGAEGVDAPLRQPGDGLHAGIRPTRPSGPAAVHR